MLITSLNKVVNGRVNYCKELWGMKIGSTKMKLIFYICNQINSLYNNKEILRSLSIAGYSLIQFYFN